VLGFPLREGEQSDVFGDVPGRPLQIEILKAAEPHGTMTRCQEETEDFEASQRELNAIGQNVNAILNRLQAFLLHLQERLEKVNPQ
jgi:hypothetical protein